MFAFCGYVDNLKEMQKPFATAIREARIAQRLKQRNVCEKIGISISVLSSWETGRAVPERNDPVIGKLAARLLLDGGVLQEKLSAQVGSGADQWSVAFAEAQSIVTKAQYQMELWSFGSPRLRVTDPGESGERARKVWKENLENGIEAHFIWHLESIDPIEFRRLAVALVELRSLFSTAPSGKMFHYGVEPIDQISDRHASPNDIRLAANTNIFDGLRAQLTDPLICCERRGLQYKISRDILAAGTLIGSTVLYRPKKFTSVPMASLVLRHVLTSPNAEELVSRVLWLPPAQVAILEDLVDRFKVQYAVENSNRTAVR